jgi:hypothetical protein
VLETADGFVVPGGGLHQVVGCGAVAQRIQRVLVGGVAERAINRSQTRSAASSTRL